MVKKKGARYVPRRGAAHDARSRTAADDDDSTRASRSKKKGVRYSPALASQSSDDDGDDDSARGSEQPQKRQSQPMKFDPPTFKFRSNNRGRRYERSRKETTTKHSATLMNATSPAADKRHNRRRQADAQRQLSPSPAFPSEPRFHKRQGGGWCWANAHR